MIADPDFAYGSVGLDEYAIPGNAAVTLTVELVNVQARLQCCDNFYNTIHADQICLTY